MDSDNVTWRWSAAQLELLARMAQTGDPDRDRSDSTEAVATRMRVALRAREHADDLVNRLMLALLDARVAPAEVAELMGLVSAQAVKRRAGRERARLGASPR